MNIERFTSTSVAAPIRDTPTIVPSEAPTARLIG